MGPRVTDAPRAKPQEPLVRVDEPKQPPTAPKADVGPLPPKGDGYDGKAAKNDGAASDGPKVDLPSDAPSAGDKPEAPQLPSAFAARTYLIDDPETFEKKLLALDPHDREDLLEDLFDGCSEKDRQAALKSLEKIQNPELRALVRAGAEVAHLGLADKALAAAKAGDAEKMAGAYQIYGPKPQGEKRGLFERVAGSPEEAKKLQADFEQFCATGAMTPRLQKILDDGKKPLPGPYNIYKGQAFADNMVLARLINKMQTDRIEAAKAHAKPDELAALKTKLMSLESERVALRSANDSVNGASNAQIDKEARGHEKKAQELAKTDKKAAEEEAKKAKYQNGVLAQGKEFEAKSWSKQAKALEKAGDKQGAERAKDNATKAATGAGDRWIRAADNQVFIDCDLHDQPTHADGIPELKRAHEALDLAPKDRRDTPEWKAVDGRISRREAKAEDRWLKKSGFDDTPTPEQIEARKKARQDATDKAIADAVAERAKAGGPPLTESEKFKIGKDAGDKAESDLIVEQRKKIFGNIPPEKREEVENALGKRLERNGHAFDQFDAALDGIDKRKDPKTKQLAPEDSQLKAELADEWTEVAGVLLLEKGSYERHEKYEIPKQKDEELPPDLQGITVAGAQAELDAAKAEHDKTYKNAHDLYVDTADRQDEAIAAARLKAAQAKLDLANAIAKGTFGPKDVKNYRVASAEADVAQAGVDLYRAEDVVFKDQRKIRGATSRLKSSSDALSAAKGMPDDRPPIPEEDLAASGIKSGAYAKAKAGGGRWVDGDLEARIASRKDELKAWAASDKNLKPAQVRSIAGGIFRVETAIDQTHADEERCEAVRQQQLAKTKAQRDKVIAQEKTQKDTIDDGIKTDENIDTYAFAPLSLVGIEPAEWLFDTDIARGQSKALGENIQAQEAQSKKEGKEIGELAADRKLQVAARAKNANAMAKTLELYDSAIPTDPKTDEARNERNFALNASAGMHGKTGEIYAATGQPKPMQAQLDTGLAQAKKIDDVTLRAAAEKKIEASSWRSYEKLFAYGAKGGLKIDQTTGLPIPKVKEKGKKPDVLAVEPEELEALGAFAKKVKTEADADKAKVVEPGADAKDSERAKYEELKASDADAAAAKKAGDDRRKLAPALFKSLEASVRRRQKSAGEQLRGDEDTRVLAGNNIVHPAIKAITFFQTDELSSDLGEDATRAGEAKIQNSANDEVQAIDQISRGYFLSANKGGPYAGDAYMMSFLASVSAEDPDARREATGNMLDVAKRYAEPGSQLVNSYTQDEASRNIENTQRRAEQPAWDRFTWKHGLKILGNTLLVTNPVTAPIAAMGGTFSVTDDEEGATDLRGESRGPKLMEAALMLREDPLFADYAKYNEPGDIDGLMRHADSFTDYPPKMDMGANEHSYQIEWYQKNQKTAMLLQEVAVLVISVALPMAGPAAVGGEALEAGTIAARIATYGSRALNLGAAGSRVMLSACRILVGGLHMMGVQAAQKAVTSMLTPVIGEERANAFGAIIGMIQVGKAGQIAAGPKVGTQLRQFLSALAMPAADFALRNLVVANMRDPKRTEEWTWAMDTFAPFVFSAHGEVMHAIGGRASAKEALKGMPPEQAAAFKALGEGPAAKALESRLRDFHILQGARENMPVEEVSRNLELFKKSIAEHNAKNPDAQIPPNVAESLATMKAAEWALVQATHDAKVDPQGTWSVKQVEAVERGMRASLAKVQPPLAPEAVDLQVQHAVGARYATVLKGASGKLTEEQQAAARKLVDGYAGSVPEGNSTEHYASLGKSLGLEGPALEAFATYAVERATAKAVAKDAGVTLDEAGLAVVTRAIYEGNENKSASGIADEIRRSPIPEPAREKVAQEAARKFAMDSVDVALNAESATPGSRKQALETLAKELRDAKVDPALTKDGRARAASVYAAREATGDTPTARIEAYRTKIEEAKTLLGGDVDATKLTEAFAQNELLTEALTKQGKGGAVDVAARAREIAQRFGFGDDFAATTEKIWRELHGADPAGRAPAEPDYSMNPDFHRGKWVNKPEKFDPNATKVDLGDITPQTLESSPAFKALPNETQAALKQAIANHAGADEQAFIARLAVMPGFAAIDPQTQVKLAKMVGIADTRIGPKVRNVLREIAFQSAKNKWPPHVQEAQLRTMLDPRRMEFGVFDLKPHTPNVTYETSERNLPDTVFLTAKEKSPGVKETEPAIAHTVRYSDGTEVEIVIPAGSHFAKLPQVEEVAKMIACLSPSERALVKRVMIEPNSPRSGELMGAIGGVLYVYPGTNKMVFDEAAGVVGHEVGHLASEKAFGNAWSNANPAGWEAYRAAAAADGLNVSGYGASALHEDFAETYSLYRQVKDNPTLLAQFRELYPSRFMIFESVMAGGKDPVVSFQTDASGALIDYARNPTEYKALCDAAKVYGGDTNAAWGFVREQRYLFADIQAAQARNDTVALGEARAKLQELIAIRNAPSVAEAQRLSAAYVAAHPRAPQAAAPVVSPALAATAPLPQAQELPDAFSPVPPTGERAEAAKRLKEGLRPSDGPIVDRLCEAGLGKELEGIRALPEKERNAAMDELGRAKTPKDAARIIEQAVVPQKGATAGPQQRAPADGPPPQHAEAQRFESFQREVLDAGVRDPDVQRQLFKLAGGDARDPLFDSPGMPKVMRAPDLLPSLDLVGAAVGKPGGPAEAYVIHADLENLAGINKAYGAEGGDDVVRQLYATYLISLQASVKRAGGELTFYRGRGGETVAVATFKNADPKTHGELLAKATAEAKADVKKVVDLDPALSKLKNPKAPKNDTSYDGTGVVTTIRQVVAGEAGTAVMRDTGEALQKQKRIPPDPPAGEKLRAHAGPPTKNADLGGEATRAPDAVPPGADSFLSVDRDRAVFYEYARQRGIKEAQAKELFERYHKTDELTGFHPPEERGATARQLISDLQGAPNVEGFYVEADISNLGGLNRALGAKVADGVYRHISNVFAEKLTKAVTDAGGEVHFFRKGGDEIAAVIKMPKDPAAQNKLKLALVEAQAEIKRWVETTELTAADGSSVKLREITHPKKADRPDADGTALTFGVAKLEPGMALRDSFSAADVNVEAKKQRPTLIEMQAKMADACGVPADKRNQAAQEMLAEYTKQGDPATRTSPKQVRERVKAILEKYGGDPAKIADAFDVHKQPKKEERPPKTTPGDLDPRLADAFGAVDRLDGPDGEELLKPERRDLAMTELRRLRDNDPKGYEEICARVGNGTPQEQAYLLGMLASRREAGRAANAQAMGIAPPGIDYAPPKSQRPTAIASVKGEPMPVFAVREAKNGVKEVQIENAKGKREWVKADAGSVTPLEGAGDSVAYDRRGAKKNGYGVGVAKERCVVFDTESGKYLVMRTLDVHPTKHGMGAVDTFHIGERFDARRNELSPADRSQLDAMLAAAPTATHQAVLVKTFALRGSVADCAQVLELVRVAFPPRGECTPQQLLRLCTADGLVQYYGDSCVFTSAQYQRALASPLEALKLVALGREGILAEQTAGLDGIGARKRPLDNEAVRQVPGAGSDRVLPNAPDAAGQRARIGGATSDQAVANQNARVAPVLGEGVEFRAVEADPKVLVEGMFEMMTPPASPPPEGLQVHVTRAVGDHALVLTEVRPVFDADGKPNIDKSTFVLRDPEGGEIRATGKQLREGHPSSGQAVAVVVRGDAPIVARSAAAAGERRIGSANPIAVPRGFEEAITRPESGTRGAKISWTADKDAPNPIVAELKVAKEGRASLSFNMVPKEHRWAFVERALGELGLVPKDRAALKAQVEALDIADGLTFATEYKKAELSLGDASVRDNVREIVRRQQEQILRETEEKPANNRFNGRCAIDPGNVQNRMADAGIYLPVHNNHVGDHRFLTDAGSPPRVLIDPTFGQFFNGPTLRLKDGTSQFAPFIGTYEEMTGRLREILVGPDGAVRTPMPLKHLDKLVGPGCLFEKMPTDPAELSLLIEAYVHENWGVKPPDAAHPGIRIDGERVAPYTGENISVKPPEGYVYPAEAPEPRRFGGSKPLKPIKWATADDGSPPYDPSATPAENHKRCVAKADEDLKSPQPEKNLPAQVLKGISAANPDAIFVHYEDKYERATDNGSDIDLEDDYAVYEVTAGVAKATWSDKQQKLLPHKQFDVRMREGGDSNLSGKQAVLVCPNPKFDYLQQAAVEGTGAIVARSVDEATQIHVLLKEQSEARARGETDPHGPHELITAKNLASEEQGAAARALAEQATEGMGYEKLSEAEPWIVSPQDYHEGYAPEVPYAERAMLRLLTAGHEDIARAIAKLPMEKRIAALHEINEVRTYGELETVAARLAPVTKGALSNVAGQLPPAEMMRFTKRLREAKTDDDLVKIAEDMEPVAKKNGLPMPGGR